MTTNAKAQGLKEGYGYFPYFIWRQGPTAYLQIPIHFIEIGEEVSPIKHPGAHIKGIPTDVMQLNQKDKIKQLHDALIGLSKDMKLKIEKDYGSKQIQLCLVVSEYEAYFLKNNSITFSTDIPWGGALLDMNNKIMCLEKAHFRTRH